MSAKNMTYISSLLMLPVLYVFFSAIHVSTHGYAIEQWLPKWDRLLILVTVIGLERLYTYRYAVSQRSVLTRDIIANIVNLYVTGAVVALVLLPLLGFPWSIFWGASSSLLRPSNWAHSGCRSPVILLSVSLFRYWMHRWQHNNEFLWSLHSYHHRVTDLKASNGEVSNPVDFALRNIVVFLVLGVIGFNPFAVLLAFTVTNVTAVFSHCGGDVKGGFLNYLFVTPEVHRWHHSAKVPEGYGYSCNYGVEFSFWDVIFGTYYLPQKDGQTVQPEHIGHPAGIAGRGQLSETVVGTIGVVPAPPPVRARSAHPYGTRRPAARGVIGKTKNVQIPA